MTKKFIEQKVLVIDIFNCRGSLSHVLEFISKLEFIKLNATEVTSGLNII